MLGVGAAPLPVAQKSDVSAIPIHMEDLQADFTQPTKHERHFGDPLATLRNLRVELASPTEAEGVTDNCPAVCGKPCIHCLQNTPNFADPAWIWGERVPPHDDTEMQEATILEDLPEVQHETVNLVCSITNSYYCKH
jgi:hypothetical protein